MLCFLGPAAIRVDGRPEPLHLRPKALAVLVRVALGGSARRSELAALVFPEAEDPRAALRWHLSYLRSTLPKPIRRQLVVTPETVRLTCPTDVDAFRRGASRLIEQHVPPEAVEVLSLYRGDLCAGLTVSASADFDTWLYVEQESLRRMFRQATVAIARRALAVGQAGEAAEPLAKLVSVDPYFEEGHILLIEAYEALGTQHAAATAYWRYQRIVRKELQAEPRPSLARRYEPDAPPGRTLPLDSLVPLREITMHVVEWPGEEPAILAIHGSAMSAYTLTALAESLAPDVRVAALDLRGHGLSDKPPGGYDLTRHVADVRELIEALRLCRPILLGFSLGGAVAAEAAAEGGVGGLILLDAVIGHRAFTDNAAAKVVRSFGESLELRLGGFTEYMEQLRPPRGRRSDDAERLLERAIRYELTPLPDGTYRRRGIRRALEETWASLAEADSLGALGRVRCPILIVQATLPWIGGKPYLTDAIIGEQLRAAPQAHHFVARHSSHPMLVRDPEPPMVEAIRRFARSCAATRAPRVRPTE
jgi:pimeloyl-ACP methyl ester carboxylesterase/DNA-binding SARP family transcriptional activator